MSEWPKTVGEAYRQNEGGWRELQEKQLVIPADLGRELYDCLYTIRQGLNIKTVQHPDTRTLDVEAVLARYEREVGK